MDTHEPDPTAQPSDDYWATVSSQMGSLGEHLRDAYRKVANGGGPSDKEIQGAFATLVGAWDQVAASLSTALRDPETRDHLRLAAGSLTAALGTTLSRLGEGFIPADRADDEKT